MSTVPSRIEADDIVVGGGSGGAVVAARLVEQGRRVVLVEAGPDYGPVGDPRWPNELVDARMLATSHDWHYAGGRWTFSRARVIGGCSSHNGAIAAVGHRSDYDGWRLPGWSAGEVAPLFATVVERMRVRAYQPSEVVPFHRECLAAAADLGWTIASDLCDLDAGPSFGLETVNVSGSTRWNTAFAYLDPGRSSTGLTIVDCTVVDRLVPTAGGIVVHGRRVDAHPFDNSHAFPPHPTAPNATSDAVELIAERVILAAGVYGTPAILQRSGVGDPDRLRAVGVVPTLESRLVGANLHDHPMVDASRTVGAELQRHLDDAAATGFLPEEQTLGKFVSSQSDDGHYDLHVFPVVASDQTSELHGRVAVEVACMNPRSRGRLDITGADPLAAPTIDHAYLSDPDDHDLAVLRDGLAIAEELLDHPLVAPLLGSSPYGPATDDEIRSRVAHYYHPVGTCAMGRSDVAVCDEAGRVRGLDNVWIADASIIPQIPRANTNLPAIMIGERIASWL
ncbi:MAG: GMC family oxidoreductase [Acidimicrobiales bacterium]